MAAFRAPNLAKVIVEGQENFHGRLAALGIPPIDFISEPATSALNMPYFKLIADPLGEPYEIGAMFRKEKDGMTYYSVVLDSPVFPTPIYAALFPDRERANGFNMVWNRNYDANRPTSEPTPHAGHAPGRRYIGAGATP